MANSGKSRLSRRRGHRQATRAHAAVRQDEQAVQRRRDWERRQRRRYVAFALMGLGVLIAASHVLEHAGAFQLLGNEALQDILLGYPTGGILFVIGLARLPAQKY